MAKYKFYVSIGYTGCNREEVMEIDDSVVEFLNEEELENFINGEFDIWLGNYTESGWYKSEKNENTYVMYMSTGYAGCVREENLTLEEGQLEGVSEAEIENIIEEEFDIWVSNFLDAGWIKL